MSEPSKFALVLFLPDAMRLNLWSEFSQILRECDASVRGAIPIRLTPSLHAELYREALRKESGDDRVPARWLLPQLFELDMGVAALAKSDRPDLQARLGGRKGSARRQGRLERTIRGASPLAERGLSLVHMPDCEEEMLRQTGLLFEGVPVSELLRSRDSTSLVSGDLGSLRGYLPLDRETTPWGLPLRLIERVLATLLWDPRVVADEALANAYRAQVDHSREQALGNLCSGHLAAMLNQAAGPECIAACSAAQAHRLTGRYWDLLGAALSLALPNRLTMLDGPRIAETLSRHNLFLDPWEKHCLSVFCAFPPDLKG